MIDKNIMTQLKDIAKNGKKFHSGQIIMVRLARIASDDERTLEALMDGERLYGVIRRTEAVKDSTNEIVRGMNEYDMQAVTEGQKRVNQLVNGYHGLHTLYLSYGDDVDDKLGEPKALVYYSVSYTSAVKILKTVVDAWKRAK